MIISWPGRPQGCSLQQSSFGQPTFNAIHRLVPCIPPDPPKWNVITWRNVAKTKRRVWGVNVNKRKYCHTDKIRNRSNTEMVARQLRRERTCDAAGRTFNIMRLDYYLNMNEYSPIHPSAVHLFLIKLHPSPQLQCVPQLSLFSHDRISRTDLSR